MTHLPQPRRLGRAMLSYIVATALLVGGGVSAAAAVNGGATVPWGGHQQESAGSARIAVATYLGYLAAGDAEAATEMVDPGVQDDCAGFISHDVFSRAQAHIAEVEIVEVEKESDSDTYVVSFEYVLDGVDYSANLTASRRNGQWLVEAATRPVNIAAGRFLGYDGTLNVSGVDIDIDVRACDWKAYPAVYRVAAPGHGLVSAEPADLLLPFAADDRPDDSDPVDLEYTLAESVVSEIHEGMVARINDCMTAAGLFGTRLQRDACSAFRREGKKSHVEDVQVEVLVYPTITVEDVYSNGVVYSAAGGTMSISYSAVDTLSESDEVQHYTNVEEDVIRVPSSFVATIVDGKIVVEPDA